MGLLIFTLYVTYIYDAKSVKHHDLKKRCKSKTIFYIYGAKLSKLQLMSIEPSAYDNVIIGPRTYIHQLTNLCY